MKTQDGKPIWNLGLEEIRENYFKLHMPDTYGELKNFPYKNGYKVSWPTNPQFTGKSGIINILVSTEKFKNAQFEVA